jgi:Fuc2NAc and GlcNAc transferase
MKEFIFAAATVSSAAIVWLVRRWAESRRIFDFPNERSSHSIPTPRGGGIGIVVVTVAGMLLTKQPLTLILCGLAIAGISWLDDLRGVPSAIRLMVHLGAAVATTISLGAWSHVGSINLGAAGWCFTVLWIAGLTNAFNFMDGIDGIAALQAVIAGLGWVVLASLGNAPALAVPGLLLAGSALGFLIQNWQPARIFMGDVGAAFLGYELAALTVLASTRGAHLAAAGVLLVWPFVFDTVFTILRRASRSENILKAHRSHLYQRLNQSGADHASVALFYGALAILGVLAAAAVVTGIGTIAALTMIALATIALIGLVRWRENH